MWSEARTNLTQNLNSLCECAGGGTQQHAYRTKVRSKDLEVIANIERERRVLSVRDNFEPVYICSVFEIALV